MNQCFICGRGAPIGTKECDSCWSKLNTFALPMSFNEFSRGVMSFVDEFEKAGGRYFNLTGTAAKW